MMFLIFALLISTIETVSSSSQLEKDFQVSQSQTLIRQIPLVANRAIDNDIDTCSEMIGNDQWWKATFRTQENVHNVIVYKTSRKKLLAKVKVTNNEQVINECQQNTSINNERFENYTCITNSSQYITGNGVNITNFDPSSNLVLCEVNVFVEKIEERQAGLQDLVTPSPSGSPSFHLTLGVLITASLIDILHWQPYLLQFWK